VPIHAKIDADNDAVCPADRATLIDWQVVAAELGNHGAAVLPALLTSEECHEIASIYADDRKFRSHIVMARHGFGKGEYKYFSYPLPKLIKALRTALYPRLAPIANEWNERRRATLCIGQAASMGSGAA
jgi:hypothetical protein